MTKELLVGRLKGGVGGNACPPYVDEQFTESPPQLFRAGNATAFNQHLSFNHICKFAVGNIDIELPKGLIISMMSTFGAFVYFLKILL